MAQKHISGPDLPAEPGSHEGAGPVAHDGGTLQAPARDRRSRFRVADDQKSGQGAMSALSRLQMIERRKAALEPDPNSPGE